VEKNVELSDAIAVIMVKNGIEEIHSFDRDFDSLNVKKAHGVVIL